MEKTEILIPIPKDAVVHEIPMSQMDRFREKFGKLERRAKKLGAPDISYTIHGAKTETKWVSLRDTFRGRPLALKEEPKKEDLHLYRTRINVWNLITVDGLAPKFAGWELAGKITPVGESVLLQVVPGAEVPERYRTSMVCEHCNTKRHRKETFVVRHEDGTFKSVGRQCLRDFLGHNSPENIAAMCTFFFSRNEPFWGEGWGGGPQLLERGNFLRTVSAVIRKDGWVSRQTARDYSKASTVDTAAGILLQMHKHKDVMEEYLALEVGPADVERTEKALAWLENMDPEGNTYLENLKVAASTPYVALAAEGVLGSIFVAHANAEKREIERKKRAERPESNWVGKVGERMEMKLTVERFNEINGLYGLITIYNMSDEHGNDIVWFCSGEPWMVKGQTYEVKATIKKHGEYKGRKQTSVSRVS